MFPSKYFAFAVKPEVYEGEDLDPDQPDSLYFIYIASKQEDLVIKKGLKAKKNRNLNLNPNLKHKAERI